MVVVPSLWSWSQGSAWAVLAPGALVRYWRRTDWAAPAGLAMARAAIRARGVAKDSRIFRKFRDMGGVLLVSAAPECAACQTELSCGFGAMLSYGSRTRVSCFCDRGGVRGQAPRRMRPAY